MRVESQLEFQDACAAVGAVFSLSFFPIVDNYKCINSKASVIFNECGIGAQE